MISSLYNTETNNILAESEEAPIISETAENRWKCVLNDVTFPESFVSSKATRLKECFKQTFSARKSQTQCLLV